MHIEKTLMKLNICFFSEKMMNYQKNIMKFGKKVKNIIKKEFDSEPLYNEKCLRPKIKTIMEKSTHIFTTLKCQKKVLN